jgi:hypothetical protein
MVFILFLQNQFSVIVFDLDVSEIVIATCPYLSFGVLIDRRDAGDAFGIDDTPFGIVVIE